MVLIDASRYAASHQEQVMEAIQQHLLLVSVPLGFALLIGGYGGMAMCLLV